MRQRIIITGTTNGIGLEMLKQLAGADYEIITACRDIEKSSAIAREIKDDNPEAVIHTYKLDLSSFGSIISFAKKMYSDFDYIDILLNNAGLFLSKNGKTEQGFEMTVGVNYVGTYYLTYLLEDIIARGHSPKIINICSRIALYGHLTYKPQRFYSQPRGLRAYASSKYMQLLWIKHEAHNFLDRGIMMYAVHPGDVHTNLWSTKNILIKLIWPMLKRTLITVEEGAKAGVYVVKNNVRKVGEMYQNEGDIMKFPKYDEEIAQKLIDYTDKEIARLGHKKSI